MTGKSKSMNRPVTLPTVHLFTPQSIPTAFYISPPKATPLVGPIPIASSNTDNTRFVAPTDSSCAKVLVIVLASAPRLILFGGLVDLHGGGGNGRLNGAPDLLISMVRWTC